MVEDAASYTDAGTAITTAVETGWISPTDPLEAMSRIHRLWLLGTARSSHTLTFKIAFDYVDIWEETYTVSSDAVVAVGTRAYIPGIAFAKQQCQAFKVRIEDSNVAAPTGTLAGLELSAIAIELATDGGRPVLADSNYGV